MKALTLWRPWPWAIFWPRPGLAKDVENRTWPPPQSVIGQQIAIHAGKRYDEESAEDIAFLLDLEELPPESMDEGIIGLATLDRVVSGGRCGMGPASPPGDPAIRSMWYHGPYGWVLRDCIRLPHPIPCRGSQGLWNVPADLEAKIAEQL